MFLLQICCVVRLCRQDRVVYNLKIRGMMETNDETMGNTDEFEGEILWSSTRLTTTR